MFAYKKNLVVQAKIGVTTFNMVLVTTVLETSDMEAPPQLFILH